jgi:glycosyltransferase involved in cell wall biosynthesis
MLSILIPTYNYNVLPLVTQLHSQCTEAGLTFEIIVIDDGSHAVVNKQNAKINTLGHCTFRELEANTGRSSIRNLLAGEAHYSWLLFLDADTLPVQDTLIKNYLPFMNGEEKVVYGGIRYQADKPADSALLRWTYGNEREALPAQERKKSPYLRLLTLNFLIHKSVFSKVRFNEAIPNLRHEDTLFSYELKAARIKVMHIENNVYHLGLESSSIFLKKSEESLEGLKYLIDNELLPAEYAGIGNLYNSITSTGMRSIFATLHKAMQAKMKKNLTGSSPSLLVFDLFRLGYICSLKK